MSDYSNAISSGDFFSGNISGSDSIVQILAELFGHGWHEIGLDAVMGGGSESASMIIAVLGAINTIALNAGALILGWVTLSATMGTAHEGQFLGKRFHDFWMPLRSGLSILFLAPVAKGGLCFVQIIGLISIGFSIQFANFIQGVGLDYMLANDGRVVALSVPPDMKENAQEVAAGLLKTLVIQRHYQLNQEKDFAPYTIDQSSGYSFRFHGPNTVFGKPQILSYVQIPNYDTSSGIATARAKAIQDMYHTLDPLALSIVTKTNADYENVEADFGIFEQSINAYIATVAPYVGELLSEYNPDYKEELSSFVKKAKEDGVIWLGSYYHTIARFSEKVHNIATDYPRLRPVNLEDISDDINILLEAALSSVRSIENQLDEKIRMARVDQGSGIFKGPLNKMTYALMSRPMNGFIKSVMDGDPLANLADWGHWLMGISETIVVRYLGLFGAAKFADGMSDSLGGKVLGLFSAGTSNGATEAGVGILSKLWSLVLFLVIPLTTLGFMLAVYLPSVPYIIWMSAIVGCLILWLEFLVHMPIWSITFATGEGEGLAGQRSQQGLLLIANALFRLPLITAGFLIAIVIMPLIGKVIGSTFMVFVGGMTAEHIVGIPTMIAVWFVFGGFTVLQTHTVYGLTTHLAEGAMKFFGGAVTSMGEAQQEARTRNMIMASLSKGESAGQGIIGRGGPTDGQNLKGKGGEQNQLASQGKSRQESDDLMPGERS